MNQRFGSSIDHLPRTDVITVALPLTMVAPLVTVEANECTDDLVRAIFRVA